MLLRIRNSLLSLLLLSAACCVPAGGPPPKVFRMPPPQRVRLFFGGDVMQHLPQVEAARRGGVDGVITFSELAAIFMAKGIDVREEEGAEMGDTSAFEYCRQFAVSEGVAGCVLSRVEDPQSIRTLPINGVDKKTFRLMKSWEKRAPEIDLVEVMCCEGGCINGPGTIVKPAVAMKLRGGSKAASPVASVKKGI